MNRRSLLTFMATVAAMFGLQVSGRAQRASVVQWSPYDESTGKSTGPETHPELYWEVVYRCPKGHEQLRYVVRKDFDVKTIAGYEHELSCEMCHIDWLKENFPPRVYADVREVTDPERAGLEQLWRCVPRDDR